MNGTQPTIAQRLNTNDGSHIIVRAFRGQQLVLVDYDGHSGFRWTADRDKAAKYPHSIALRIADKAAREYGAKCATLAADGTLTQPESARETDAAPRLKIQLALAAVRDLMRTGHHDSLDDAITDVRMAHKLSASEARAVRGFYECGMDAQP